MFRNHMIALPLLVLAACGSGGGDNATQAPDGSGAGVSAAAGGVKLRPGQWEMVSEVTGAEMPGVPAGMLKDAIGRKQTITHCLTSEEAARPQSEFFNRPQPEANCRQESLDMSGGTIRAAMVCAGNGQGEMRTTMEGRYQSDSYDLTTTIRMAGTGQGAPGMNMTAHVTGRRVGECPAGTAGAAPKIN